MTVEDLINALKQQPLAATVRVVGVIVPPWAESEEAYEHFNRGPDRVTYHHGEVTVICD